MGKIICGIGNFYLSLFLGMIFISVAICAYILIKGTVSDKIAEKEGEKIRRASEQEYLYLKNCWDSHELKDEILNNVKPLVWDYLHKTKNKTIKKGQVDYLYIGVASYRVILGQPRMYDYNQRVVMQRGRIIYELKFADKGYNDIDLKQREALTEVLCDDLSRMFKESNILFSVSKIADEKTSVKIDFTGYHNVLKDIF